MNGLKINHLQHVGIPVTDLRISTEFYEKLGFESVMDSSFEFNGEGGGLVSMLKHGDIVLELYQMPATELEIIRQRHAGRIDHIAFDVDDAEATFHLLKDAGYNVLEEAPVLMAFWDNGCKYFFITGPDGERLEFNEIVK